MADGEGCTCYAYSASECACDADWTPQIVYDQQVEIERLRTEMLCMQHEVREYQKAIKQGQREILLKAADMLEGYKMYGSNAAEDVRRMAEELK
jgi:hypothetical protein